MSPCKAKIFFSASERVEKCVHVQHSTFVQCTVPYAHWHSWIGLTDTPEKGSDIVSSFFYVFLADGLSLIPCCLVASPPPLFVWGTWKTRLPNYLALAPMARITRRKAGAPCPKSPPWEMKPPPHSAGVGGLSLIKSHEKILENLTIAIWDHKKKFP